MDPPSADVVLMPCGSKIGCGDEKPDSRDPAAGSCVLRGQGGPSGGTRTARTGDGGIESRRAATCVRDGPEPGSRAATIRWLTRQTADVPGFDTPAELR